MRFFLPLALALATLAVTSPKPAFAEDLIVDLELVLAVDASGSVDEPEFRLQIDGIADAFRDRRVLDAIARGRDGRIGVAMLIWADATVPKFETGWFVVRSAADAEAFSSHIRTLPRTVVGGTGIGAGIAASMRMFERNGLRSLRQVVDVSGDGPETPPRDIVVTMPQARSMARARGVTINGLAILNEEPELDRWYRDNVISGPQSFVISAADYPDFAEAMVRKLIREIDDQPMIGMADDNHPAGKSARSTDQTQGELVVPDPKARPSA